MTKTGELESIEKLREYVGKELYEKERIGHGDYSHLYVLIEDVKREIAERYMLLPMDADGVPIRVGSKVVCSDGVTRTVMAVTDDGACLDTIEHYGRLRLHVVKPRTIEDVLRDFFGEYVTTKETQEEDDYIIEKYAAELRSMGVRE